MTNTPSPRPVALVTGASAGIGRELAHLFAADGHEVALVARRETLLRELATELGERHGVAAHILPADLANPDAPMRLAEEIEAAGLHVTHLANNAGFGIHGRFATHEPEVLRDMIEVNVTALTALTRAFLPSMLERRHGRILNVASTAAFQPGPFMAVYYATKAYVLSFSVALAEEIEGSGVTVTTLCPGPTRTDFADRAGVTESKIFAEQVTMTPQAVARIGYRAMCRGQRVAVTGVANRVLATAARTLPATWGARIVKSLQPAQQREAERPAPSGDPE